MSTIQLVYCRENANIAEKIAHELGRIGIPFQHLTNRPGDLPGHLYRQVQLSDEPVLWLLTDNFLKNEVCMASALAMFQTLRRQNRLLTLVAEGRISRDGDKTYESVPTQFDRVVHAIQYMNYWQTAYLDRNAAAPEIPPGEKETYEQQLETVRGIANEIGELFSALREAGYHSREQFEADHYALFFRHFGLQEWHEQYRKLATLEEEIPVPPIPEAVHSAPVAETPVFSGPLAPQPTEPETAQIALAEHPVFNGMDRLLEEIQVEEEALPAPETSYSDAASRTHPENSEQQLYDEAGNEEPRSVLERLIGETETAPEARESEIRQMAQDAWFWLEKGYTERGMELFRLAIEQYPEEENLRAEFEKARAQYGLHEPGTLVEPEPEAPVETVANNHSQEAESYFQMGENALAKGDYLLAKYCWDRVTELQPKYPGIYRRLALLTSDHLTDYRETAAHYLEEALAADSDDADLHYRLAVLLRDHLEQPEQALQHFRDAAVLQPDHARTWLALAQCTLDAGDTAEAETLYRHAVLLDDSLQSEELDARFLPTIPPPAEPAPEEIPEPAIGEYFPEQKEETETTEIEPARALESFQTPATESQQLSVKTAEPLTVLITGASSGIGRATALEFARHGHRVILTGRRGERLDALRQTLGDEFDTDAYTLEFDVRDPEAVRQHLEMLPEAWQNIDLLINNAGLARGLAPIHEGDLDHWDTMIDTNIKGLLYVTRCVAPGMVRRRKGHIINVGSAAGKEVYANGNVYCATKFAVDALTRAMRLDLHAHNIRVSQVSPGHVEETEFAITRFEGDAEKARIYDDFQPLKASDVAEAIYFIATRPAHVNIQDIWMYGTQQASVAVVDRSGR